MKYKVGDKLTNDGNSITIEGIIGRVYIVIYGDDEACTYAEKELDYFDYTLIEPEKPVAPPKGTVCLCTTRGGNRGLRVSAGELDHNGGLVVYVNGEGGGFKTSFENWEVVKQP